MPNCTQCSMARFCLPSGMRQAEVARLVPLVRRRIRLLKGDALYRTGAAAAEIYAVRVGTIKTTVSTECGRSQIVRFHLPGEIVGLDSLTRAQYQSCAVALEAASLCVISTERLQALTADFGPMRQRLLNALGDEAQQDRHMVTMLGLMSADERVAGFLLSLSERLSVRGYAASEFLLRMSREDIGSYLGLKLETVSRTLSRLISAGLIAVRARHVRILDKGTLADISRGHAPIPPACVAALPRLAA